LDERRLLVGIDSYCLISTDLDPINILEWTKEHSGQGVQFTGIPPHLLPPQGLDPGFLRELGQHARNLGLYMEWGGAPHIPFNLETGAPIDIREGILEAARQARLAGCRIVRSCSGGLMRWRDNLPPTEVLLSGMVKTLAPLVPVLQDLGVTLALETHFEFTTFEFLRVFESCQVQPGEGLGICLDIMNLMIMLEDPLMATDRILPWVVATHAKDGCIVPYEEGFQVFTTRAGKGVIPWHAIIKRLRRLSPPVTLSIEDHGGVFDIPYLQPTFLSRFPDLSVQELVSLQRMARRGQQLVNEGRIAPVSRQDWPRICLERVASGIKWLRSSVC